MSSDPYAALGLKKTATQAEIKKAYRKIARASHPDINPGKAAEAKFKAASSAYDLLKDPETRGRFDRGEIDATGAERPERHFYREYAEAPGNPYRSEQFSGSGFGGAGGTDEAADIFAEFLRQRAQGGAAPGAQGFNARGADLRYALEVSFLDAAKGATRRITLPGGDTLDVKIPQGTADGQTIRLRGKGAAGYGKGPRGDALVTLSVHPHPIFRRDGNDIVITLPITLDEAILGGKVEAPTIDGPVKLTVPKGASSGQTLRLRGRGVAPMGKAAAGKAAARGDQRVELRIVTPPEIDDKLRAFMQDWRKSHSYDPRQGVTS